METITKIQETIKFLKEKRTPIDKSIPNHQHCKNCGKEIPISKEKFCCDNCRKEWRRKYQAAWQLRKMRKTKYKYLKEWRKKNPDKVKAQRKRYLERKKKLNLT